MRDVTPKPEPKNTKDVNADKRKLKGVLIQPSALLQMFGACLEGKYLKVEGIPPGSVCVSMAIDPASMLLVLFIEHESFDEIDIKHPVPTQEVKITVGTPDGSPNN